MPEAKPALGDHGVSRGDTSEQARPVLQSRVHLVGESGSRELFHRCDLESSQARRYILRVSMGWSSQLTVGAYVNLGRVNCFG